MRISDDYHSPIGNSSRIFLNCVMAGLTTVIFSNVQAQIPEVPSSHPRVYVRPSELSSIRKKIKSQEFSKTWEDVKDSKDILCRAFVYLITEDKKAGRQAIEGWFNSFKENFDNSSRRGRVFYNLIHVGACVYDWCYRILSEEEKKKFISRFERAAASHAPGYPADINGHAIVGHGTEGWLLTGQLPAGVAIYDESKIMYDAAVALFFDKFVSVRNFFYPAHMHHQGDSYSQTRFQHDQAVSWLFRRMGAGDVFTDEMCYVPYQWIYYMRPDGQQMRSGDTFDDRGRGNRKRFISLLTGCYYDEPYLMTMADSDFFHGLSDSQKVFELLFRKPNMKKRPISELPLTKYFAEPMGEMVARTGWNMGVESKDAVVHMRIGEYFFGNHQHKDFGIFQIYYRGPLAISTGIYGDYGSEHWNNYYHQTISKNGILIFDPSEEPHKGSANDGGQRWPEGSDHPKNLEVLLSPDYKMGEVTAHEFGPDDRAPDYSYIAGDITNAYSSHKVNQVTRSMVSFNTHNLTYPCVFVVFDRVVATNPQFKKKWLLHSIQEPKVEGHTTTIIRDGKAYGGGEYSGKLVVENLLPEKVNITKIGGPGKEFWIESTQTNYLPADILSWKLISKENAKGVLKEQAEDAFGEKFLFAKGLGTKTGSSGTVYEIPAIKGERQGWTFWARRIMPDGSSDSFFWDIREDADFEWGKKVPDSKPKLSGKTKEWAWGNGGDFDFEDDKGNFLRISERESNWSLDVICLRNDGLRPTDKEYQEYLKTSPEKREKTGIIWIEAEDFDEEKSVLKSPTQAGAVEPGAWRIEVAPAVNTKSNLFFHVLTVMDKTVSHKPMVQKVENDKLVGAALLDLAVFFSKNGQLLNNIKFDVDGEGMIKILVCNLEPGIWTVRRNGRLVEASHVTDEGKCIYFKGLPGSYLLEFIS